MMFRLGKGRDSAAKLAALDRSQAIIEFDTGGNIVTANQNFLDVLGYSLGEIQGKHHSMFVEAKERDGVEYRRFWDDLRAGKFQQAEYKPIRKGGKEIWIQATYNPLLNSAGKAFKGSQVRHRRYCREAEERRYSGPDRSDTPCAGGDRVRPDRQDS